MSTTLSGSIITSYDLSVGVIVDMDELIYMLSPADSPLLSGVDADGKSVLSTVATNERQVDWMTDELLTPRSLTTTQIANTTTANVLSVTTGDQAKFSTGDVLMLAVGTAGSSGAALEYVRVTGYGTTADTLLVTRAWTTTPAVATVVTGSLVIGVGTALAEGSDPQNSRFQDRVQYSNVTQIFGPTAVKMSKTEQVVAKYGVSDEFTRQVFMRTKEQVIHREQAFLYGLKVSDSANKLRTLGGMFSFVTTNVATTTALNITSVQTQQQVCYNNGGMPDRLGANPASLADINALTDTQRVRQTFEDPRRGRIPVMEIWTEFGPLAVVRNRWMNKSDALLWTREQAVRRPLRPLSMERLAKTGDSDIAMIVCEETLEFKGQQHASKFNALTYA